MNIDANQVVAALIAILAVSGSVFGVFKLKGVRAAIVALLTESPHSLRQSIDSLSAVVSTQGEAIEWLRSEIEAKNQEIERLNTRLLEMAELASENSNLRRRIGELEEQVTRLETELARRRKYTRKDYRTKAEEPNV